MQLAGADCCHRVQTVVGSISLDVLWVWLACESGVLSHVPSLHSPLCVIMPCFFLSHVLRFEKTFNDSGDEDVVGGGGAGGMDPYHPAPQLHAPSLLSRTSNKKCKNCDKQKEVRDISGR